MWELARLQGVVKWGKGSECRSFLRGMASVVLRGLSVVLQELGFCAVGLRTEMKSNSFCALKCL